MAGTIAGVMVYVAGGMLVLQAIFGLVQWFKPNRVIPVLFILLVAIGLLSSISGLAMTSQADASAAIAAPLWFTVLGFVALIIEPVLHIAGFRGASKLAQLNRAEFPNS